MVGPREGLGQPECPPRNHSEKISMYIDMLAAKIAMGPRSAPPTGIRAKITWTPASEKAKRKISMGFNQVGWHPIALTRDRSADLSLTKRTLYH